jgi:hypothetical protein
MKARFILYLPLLACTALAAQTLPAPLPPVQESPALQGRKNQKIEHIHVEDSGASIDELRVGGQTQSITVQPKADVPAYEITPTDMARTRPADQREGLSSANGQRVWDVLKF